VAGTIARPRAIKDNGHRPDVLFSRRELRLVRASRCRVAASAFAARDRESYNA
jgi:hypothetical protein